MGYDPSPTRRPTVIHRSNPITSSPISGETSHRISTSRNTGYTVAVGDDNGLVMRERGDESIGKSGVVGVGVTRPKRRLSR